MIRKKLSKKKLRLTVVFSLFSNADLDLSEYNTLFYDKKIGKKSARLAVEVNILPAIYPV